MDFSSTHLVRCIRQILLCSIFAGIFWVDAAAPTSAQIRKTIQRAIPFVEEKGVNWIEKKDCVSCHRVSTMVWSLSLARAKGFKVSDELDEWIDWSVKKSLAKNDKGKIIGHGNKEGVAQLLLGMGDLSAAKRGQLVALLPNAQLADGSWKPGGQLPGQKRPLPETSSVSTLWLALALLESANVQAAAVAVKAIESVEKSAAGKSTEWYALRLMIAVQSEEKVARAKFIKSLRQQQNADGGWGWMVGEESDALGTGMAMYALQRAGLDHHDATLSRAQQFLIGTQGKNGSWPVRGTKAKKKKSVQETSTYWGTTWAVIALGTGLPQRPE